MKKLGKRNYDLISISIQILGFNEPSDAMMHEERMYVDEVKEIWKFLEWLHKSNKPFGKVNYEQRFAEFKRNDKVEDSWYEVKVNFPGTKDKNYPNGPHSHIKRISGDHTNMMEICSNLDDRSSRLLCSNKKEYDLKNMKKFVEDNKMEVY